MQLQTNRHLYFTIVAGIFFILTFIQAQAQSDIVGSKMLLSSSQKNIPLEHVPLGYFEGWNWAKPIDSYPCIVGVEQPVEVEVLESREVVFEQTRYINNENIKQLIGQKFKYDKIKFPKGKRRGCPQRSNDNEEMEGWVMRDMVTYTPVPKNETDLMPNSVDDKSAGNNFCAKPDKSCTANPAQKSLDSLQAIRDFGMKDELYQKQSAPGLKSLKEIDRYLACYPAGGGSGFETYKELSPFFNLANKTFRISSRRDGVEYETNPGLMRCLIQRESQFNPQNKATGENGGATGLGQHIQQNIDHINQRLSKPDSWERTVWNNYFDQVRKSDEGRKMLAACPGVNKLPTFKSKEDAKCPLLSIAASHIYNLHIQMTLAKNGGEARRRQKSLDYHLAIAAAYNVGEGRASTAVENATVGNWVSAIIRHAKMKATNNAKRKEIPSHVEAIKNCMEDGNFKPMHEKDRPKPGVCSANENINSRKPAAKTDLNLLAKESLSADSNRTYKPVSLPLPPVRPKGLGQKK